MNIVTDNLQQIIDAPDGIKRLRELILQLAVQGKLVEQRTEDGTAADLLKQIEKAKATDLKKRKANGDRITKPKYLPPISAELIPFDVPDSWEWVRFLSINTVQSKLVSAIDFPYEKQIAPDSIEKGNGSLICHRTVSDSGVTGPNNKFHKGQILYSKIRPSLNKVVIAPYDGLCSADMYPINCYCDSNYCLIGILSGMFLAQVKIAENRVKMPKLNLLSLGQFVFPLPPLPEQKRIVAKVDELMKWCDELKELKQKRETIRKAALKSSLLDLTNQGGTIATNRVFDNFADLIRTPKDVKQMRDAILQLAVQGRLVEQRPEDGTAADLLKEIKKAKATDQKQRKANGDRIRKAKPLPPISAEEIPFGIPDNWEWVRLATVGNANPRNYEKDSTMTGFVPMRNISAAMGTDVTFAERPWAEIRSGFTHIANNDVVIAKITPCYENGKSAVINNLPNGMGAGTTELHVFRNIKNTLDPCYVLINFKSPTFLVTGQTKMTGSAGQKRIPKDYVFGTPFPLPPLPEQKRIVAKVDELISWCDELEALLTSEADTAARFAAAVAKCG